MGVGIRAGTRVSKARQSKWPVQAKKKTLGRDSYLEQDSERREDDGKDELENV